MLSAEASSNESFQVAEGGCSCRAVRYRMTRAPMIVHCCHCRWCQRESGAAFALNAVVEAASVEQLGVAPEIVVTPSQSGRGQKIARCPTCRVGVHSHYPTAGDRVSFVRVGTLDEPDRFPPDVHIYVSSKQPWVVLPEGARTAEEFYDPATTWTEESRARMRAVRTQSA